LKLEQSELVFIIQATRQAIIKGEDAPMVAGVIKKIADELDRITKKDGKLKLEKDCPK